MRLDELIEQTTIHEKTVITVDRRVTLASRTILGCCAASAVVYNQTRVDDASNLVSFIVDWFGFPTAGYFYTIIVLAVGSGLLIITKGFTQADQRTHRIVVGFTIAAVVTAIPIVLAVVVWTLFVVAIIAMFAAVIGFAVLVIWALLQAS